MDVLKQGGGGSAGRSRSRAALVVAETALAFVLTAAAGLTIRTLSGLLDVPNGLAAPDRVLVADLDLPRANYPDERIQAFAQQFMAHSPSAPRIPQRRADDQRAAGSRARGPISASASKGRTHSRPASARRSEIVWATPGYLDTLGIPLLRGRDLRWTDVRPRRTWSWSTRHSCSAS